MNWICFDTSFLGDEVAHILQCTNAKDANKKEECDKRRSIQGFRHSLCYDNGGDPKPQKLLVD